jgi:hypothetical protein
MDSAWQHSPLAMSWGNWPSSRVVPANATIVAETELRLLDLTHGGFDRLLDDIPGFAKHLLYEVTLRLVAATAEDAY